MSTIVLREYQSAACDAAERDWSSGHRRVLLVMATGLGKTVCIANLIKRDHERGGRRALVLAHRDELLEQAANKIRLVHPDASIGFVRREQNEIDRDVVVASVQSIAGEKRLLTLPLDFSLVVVDEAHHSVAPYHLKILHHVGALSDHPGAPKLLGVTATPQRTDGVGLADVYEKISYRMGILEGIIKGFLCDLRVEAIRVRVDLSKVGTKMDGDFAEGALGKALMAADAPEQIVLAHRRSAFGRKTLCFTPTVEMAKAVTDSFLADGVTAEWLSGETPIKKRRQIISRLESGETQVLCNASALTEGFDCPSISCVVLARPTKSAALYIQIVGRGSRPSPQTGKKDCIVLDVAGSSETLRLVTLADITGLPASELEKKSVLEVIREQEDEYRPTGGRPEGIVEHLPAANQFSEFSWTKLKGSFSKFYALALAQGGFLYAMPASAEMYDVLMYDRSSADAAEGYMEPLAENLPLDYALGYAEDHVRDRADMRLTVANAAWRGTPASDKQLDFIRTKKIQAPAVLTKGQAADLINAHLAQATLDRLLRVQTR